MIADILTKALPGPIHKKFVKILGMEKLSDFVSNFETSASAQFQINYN